jgi:hypothetical protein
MIKYVLIAVLALFIPVIKHELFKENGLFSRVLFKNRKKS